MRIVVDTNVLASAVYFGGKPFKLLKLIMEEQISAIASKEIVEEYEEILVRLQQKFPKLSKSIPFQDIVGKLTVINVSSDIHICRDPDDDKFISCAVDGKCIYIVSGDNDLLELKGYEGIEIITVARFFERLGIEIITVARFFERFDGQSQVK